jgi:hypothetical protein
LQLSTWGFGTEWQFKERGKNIGFYLNTPVEENRVPVQYALPWNICIWKKLEWSLVQIIELTYVYITIF